MTSLKPPIDDDNVRYGPMGTDEPDVVDVEADAPAVDDAPKVEDIPEGTPTQVAHPNRATLRTVVVVAATTLLLLVAIAPDVIAAILDEPAITGELRAILAGTSAVLAAVAAAIQRIALIPGVNAAIERYLPWLATGVQTEIDAVLGDRPQGRHAKTD